MSTLEIVLTSSIGLLVLIIAIAGLIRSKRNTPINQPNPKNTTNSPAQNTSTVPQKSNIMGITGGIIGVILGILLGVYLVVLIYNSLFGEKEIVYKEPPKETLELVLDEYTPIKIDLYYRFELETEGLDTIYLKLPGVIEPVEYSAGRGEVIFPPRRSGLTEIYAKNKPVKVKISKKVLQ